MQSFKDSGTRRDFGTGAVRDAAVGKGRFDLLAFDALQELARVYEIGAAKYTARNWEGGIPISTYLDSAARHLAKAISGHVDEPHLPMAMWNIACAIQTEVWVRERPQQRLLDYDYPIRLCRDDSIGGQDDGEEVGLQEVRSEGQARKVSQG